MGCKVEESIKKVEMLLGSKVAKDETKIILNNAKKELELILSKRDSISGSKEIEIEKEESKIDDLNKTIENIEKEYKDAEENINDNIFSVDSLKSSEQADSIRRHYKNITGSSIQYKTLSNYFNKTISNKSKSDKEKIKNIEKSIELAKEEKMGSINSDIGIRTDESIEFNMKEEFEDFISEILDNDLTSGSLNDLHHQNLSDVAINYIEILEDYGLDITSKVNIYENYKKEVDPIGEFDPNTGEININLGKTNKFFSKSEVILHELQHKLIDAILSSNPGSKLNKDIRKLRDLARDQINKKYDGNGFRMFLTDKPDVDFNDDKNSDVIIAKKIFKYVFENAGYKGENAGLKQNSEFLAYATTNKYVMNELYSVKIKDDLYQKFEIKNKEKGIKVALKRIANIFIEIINSYYSQTRHPMDPDEFGKRSGKAMGSELLKTALENMAREEKNRMAEPEVDGKIKEMYKKYESKASPVVEKMGETLGFIDEKNKGVSLKKNRGIGKWFSKITNYKGLARLKKEMILANATGNAFKDTANNRHAWFYQLVRSSKHNIDSEVQTLKDVIRKKMNNDLGMDKINEETRKVLKRTLIDTDSIVLELDDVKKYMLNPDELDKAIENISKDIQDDFAISHAEMLGYQLYNGEPAGWNAYNNAQEIARDSSVNFKADGIHKIDKLATLFAIKQASEQDREKTGLFIENFRASAEGIFNSQREYRKELVKGIYLGKSIMVEKGFKQEAYNSVMDFQIVKEEDVESMKRINKYDVIKEVTDLKEITGERYYLMSGVSTDTSYTEGLISTVQLRSEGLSLRGVLIGQGKDVTEINSIIKALSESTRDDKINEGKHQFIPVRTPSGQIDDYRLVVGQQDKAEYLDINNDIVETMVNTFGNTEHKYLALENNVRAVNAMIDFSSKNYKGNEDEFVTIRPSSKSEKEAGIEYKFAKEWARLPEYTRRYIYYKTGESAIKIPADMLTDFIGYKDVSIQNLPGIKGTTTLKKALGIVEKTWKDLIKRYKSLIVITMGNTILGNYQSNAVVTMSEAGIGPVEYSKRFTDQWENLNQYMADHKELVGLRFLKEAGNKGITEERIKGLENDLKANPIYELVVDGQFSTILEDIDLEEAKKQTVISKKIDEMLNKTPEAMKDIRDFVYLDEKSTAYQKLMKITQYADIVNRAIIHDEFIKKGIKEKQDSLNYVDQLFVNYSYLDNKYLKWGSDMGALWFTKFLFRSLPAVAKSVARKPIMQAMLQAAQSITGINLEQPMDNYFNVFNSMMNRMGPIFSPVDMFSTLLTPNVLNPILR